MTNEWFLAELIAGILRKWLTRVTVEVHDNNPRRVCVVFYHEGMDGFFWVNTPERLALWTRACVRLLALPICSPTFVVHRILDDMPDDLCTHRCPGQCRTVFHVVSP